MAKEQRNFLIIYYIDILMIRERKTKHMYVCTTESESNRTFPIQVRFGSTEFLKSRFGFGSVRLNFQKVSSSSVRFGSIEFLKCRFEFGSVRANKNSQRKLYFSILTTDKQLF
jgi:hypothetical protein